MPKLSITSHCAGARVGYHGTVRGKVTPGNTPVQVVVYSNDSQWYVQQDAVVKGSHWKADCCFGLPDSPDGWTYTITAVAGPKLTKSPIPDVPESHTQSRSVTVVKRA